MTAVAAPTAPTADLIVHSRRGEAVVRVSTQAEAERYQAILKGDIRPAQRGEQS